VKRDVKISALLFQWNAGRMELPQLSLAESPGCGQASGGRRRARAAANASTRTSQAVRPTESKNVYVLALDSSSKPLSALRGVVESLKTPSGGKKSELVSKRWKFHAERPSWKSDIRWVSAADEATLRGLFLSLFEKLAITEHFRFLGEMVMFSGFFVLRQDTRKSHFHKDFGDTGNRAFTLMTPLYEMGHLPDCHLLCRVELQSPPAPEAAAAAAAAVVPQRSPKAAQAAQAAEATSEIDPVIVAEHECEHLETKQYRYKLGEAIVFGDGFEHATQTGRAPVPLAFLCFTFGDRNCTEEEWSAAQEYISQQGPIYQDPCGRLVSSPSVHQ
jgi:hypothetical protein